MSVALTESSAPLLLLQQGPDSPFGNVLGWLIVFMVIVWPILRGVIEAATKRRREFQAGQKRGGGGASAGRPGAPARRGGGLRDMLAQTMEALEEEATGKRRARPGAPSEGPRGESPPRRVATTPTPRGAETLTQRAAGPPGETTHRDLVGDPFDDSTMGLDLVPDDRLQPVPSEDALESDYGASMPAPGGTRAAFVEPPPRKLSELDRPEVRKDKDVLGRLGRRLTPWQRAIALNEILGPPVAGRPPTQRDF